MKALKNDLAACVTIAIGHAGMKDAALSSRIWRRRFGILKNSIHEYLKNKTYNHCNNFDAKIGFFMEGEVDNIII